VVSRHTLKTRADNAELRRGKGSANSRWGNQIAVLVGDFFYCRASDLLVGLGNLKVIDLITRVMQTTTEGEIFEIV
jgi:octaprenyl-diphosphate synthase